MKLVEVRTYRLRAGSRERFHELFAAAQPLVRTAFDVVAFGPSAHDPDSYFLIRAFADVAHRQASQDAFYGSDAWRQGPREAIVALIVDHLDATFLLDAAGVDALRR